jgi:hypothetical protein
MTFLAPAYLLAAGLAALAVVGLHFLSAHEPPSAPLPTTRFIPDSQVQAFALTVRLSEVPLLLLRVVLILLIGAALARPVWTAERMQTARIVAVDVSRAIGSPRELIDSAGRYVEGAAAVLLFDHEVRTLRPEVAAETLAAWAAAHDTARSEGARGRRASLSAAFIAASRAAARLRDRADSLELVVVSGFVEEQRDAATLATRALWPGGVRLVPVARARPAGAGDGERRPHPVRIEWADSGRAAGWLPRAVPDTVGAVRSGDVVLVHPFPRRWRLALADEAAGETLGRVYAWWSDGEPAAFERLENGACVRTIGFAIPEDGDVRLRPAFQQFLAGLQEPCGEPEAYDPLPDEFMAALAGPASRASADDVERADLRTTPLMPWLLGAALLVALMEMVARRRRRRAA